MFTFVPIKNISVGPGYTTETNISLINLPSYNLLMHVIEQFTTSVFVDNALWSLKRVHQVPVPVVEVQADIFAEIAEFVLRVQVRGGKISRYFNCNLLFTVLLQEHFYFQPG